ncbi:MAG TPA: Arm DNA-binding domain-containing protein [Candidimonas sp.]|nr:Arm DNA-binding domain-containing protein [Candidimonas sp.]
MLTDKALAALKPKDKIFKVTDRDGMYVAVLPTGTISYRYDHRLKGGRETLVIRRYDPKCRGTQDPDELDYGMSQSLRDARTLLDRRRRDVEQGESPSCAKVDKRMVDGFACDIVPGDYPELV